MALIAGTRLGPYEIVSAIGAGGMGEVYRATDARLGRAVAIKVLRESVAHEADRRARFEREAKAIAALSHPNIVNIHDAGLHEGHAFIVMELLDGETLRARLAGGALPVRKAVEIAVQIARGLAAAHDRQIVHRDLKPENIFIVRNGQVKILDFGLARDIATSISGATETRAALTDTGVVMGTVGYMAPEQIRAQAVDGRTDVFAFGATLFEMLSGRRAFQRDTSADTQTAILTADPPDLLSANTQIGAPLDRIVRHCLEKIPAERFQSAHDVAFALDALSGSASAAIASASETHHAPPVARRSTTFAVASVLLIAAAAAGFIIGRGRTPAAPFIEFERKTWTQDVINDARFLPDGKSIVFSAGAALAIRDLYALRPGTVAPQMLAKGVYLLSVSSKGELAVLENATENSSSDPNLMLSRMTIDGAPRPWLDHVTDADWSPDGNNVAVVHVVNGKQQLEYPIGKVLHSVASGYLSDVRVSPDGSAVAFMEHQFRDDDRGWLKLVTATGATTTLAGEFFGGQKVAWTRDGSTVVFSAAAAGFAYQMFEVNAVGEPRVRQRTPNSSALFLEDISADGSELVTEESRRLGMKVLLPGESDERDISWLGAGASGEITRDGKKVAFNDQGPGAGANYQVAVLDVASGNVVRMGSGISWGVSPDGRLAGGTISSTAQNILYATGPGPAIELPRGAIGNLNELPRWFADSRRIYFCGREQGHAPRCYQQDIAGGLPEAITDEGTISALLAGDQRTLLTGRSDGTFAVGRIGTSEQTQARGLKAGDTPLTWTVDGRAVVVTRIEKQSVIAERVDLATGQRTTLRTITLSAADGFGPSNFTHWGADGKSYAYGYVHRAFTLYVMTRKPQDQ